MSLQFPLGMINFIVFITLLGISLTFLLSPIIRLVIGLLAVPVDAGQSGIINSIILPSSPVFLPLFSLLGFMMLATTMHLAKLIGRVYGKFVKFLLVRK